MYLEEMEAEKFYHTWLGLLEFTNQKYNIAPELKKMRGAKVLNPQQLLPIKNKLWEDESIIDEYLKQNENNIDTEERETIKSLEEKGIRQIYYHEASEELYGLHACGRGG